MFIAIDFDGTIVDHMYPEIGNPVPGAVDWIKRFKEAGATLILLTMRGDGSRSGDVLTSAVQYCRDNGIEFDFVNENPQDWTTSNKVYAHIYIDDSAFGCPLVENTISGRRPFVDWAVVGPAVLERIEVDKKKTRSSLANAFPFPIPGK